MDCVYYHMFGERMLEPDTAAERSDMARMLAAGYIMSALLALSGAGLVAQHLYHRKGEQRQEYIAAIAVGSLACVAGIVLIIA
jgi:hypothetical protein